jgi:hypothetical protein
MKFFQIAELKHVRTAMKARPDARQSAMKAGLSRMAAHERDELGPKCPLVADPSLSVGRNAPPACRKPSMKRPIRLREKIGDEAIEVQRRADCLRAAAGRWWNVIARWINARR